MSKLQEIKNTIMTNQPSENIKIIFENDEGEQATADGSYFSGELIVYDYTHKIIHIVNEDTTFYLDGVEYSIKDAVEISFCKRQYVRLK